MCAPRDDKPVWKNERSVSPGKETREEEKKFCFDTCTHTLHVGMFLRLNMTWDNCNKGNT